MAPTTTVTSPSQSNSPGGLLRTTVCGSHGLPGWLWLVEWLERIGAGLIFAADLTASPWVVAAYYGLLLLAAHFLVRFRGKNSGNFSG